MKNNLKIKIFLLISVLVFSGFTSIVNAEESTTFFIRNGESLLWNGPIAIPDEGTIEIPDNNGDSHTVDARSVLAVLYSADEENDAFSLSNLQFYDSFGSFYVKCITDASGVELCDNWQYAVGSTTPWQSIDTITLSGGETVGIYFGTAHRLSFTDLDILTGESLNVTAESYDYSNNTWNPLSGVSVGVTLPNPDDPWNPIVVLTSPVDETGSVDIVISEPNSYSLGIVEDFYFPLYTITVLLAPIDENITPVSSGGGGGGMLLTIINSQKENVEEEVKFNTEKAFEFLISQQKENGSFGGNLYTDWATLALSLSENSQKEKTKLIQYLLEIKTDNYQLTDYERYSMALMSLGLNPYNISGKNYIKKITDAFDGTQFGDNSLVNDDIFALLPLASAGYTENDDLVVKDISFILSKQDNNGSWENSVDLTAAAIQALHPFVLAGGVNDAILSASTYLQSMQKEDGGWDSVYSTSWAMQAMNMLNESWVKNNKNPIDYLELQQASDGAVLSLDETLQNRIWATSYVIPAVLGQSWNMIFKKVEKVTEDSVINEPVAILATSQDTGNTTKVINKITKVDKKVVDIQPISDTLVASVVESDIFVPKKSLLEMIISTGLAILLKLIF